MPFQSKHEGTWGETFHDSNIRLEGKRLKGENGLENNEEWGVEAGLASQRVTENRGCVETPLLPGGPPEHLEKARKAERERGGRGWVCPQV